MVKNMYTLRIFLSYDFLLLNSFMIFESDMKTARMPIAKYHLRKSLLLILSVFYLYSCEEGGKLINDPKTTFDTGYYDMEFLVEENDRVGFQIFAEEVYENNTSLLFSTLGLQEEQVEEIILKEAEISYKESDGYDNFDLLKNIELTVYTDELGETKVAWLSTIPMEQTKLILDLSEENILPYFQESNFMLTSQGFLKNRVSGNLKLLVKVKFQIKASL